MPTAARNTSGNRQSTASALNAPIEAPAATIGVSSPPRSARIAGTTSCRTQWWNWLNSHIRYSGEPAFGHHRLPGHAVARVELDPAALDQRPAGADEAVALDLLGVPARRGEDQDRGAVVAPPGQTDRLLQTLGVPAVGHLHVVHPGTDAATRQRDRAADQPVPCQPDRTASGPTGGDRRGRRGRGPDVLPRGPPALPGEAAALPGRVRPDAQRVEVRLRAAADRHRRSSSTSSTPGRTRRCATRRSSPRSPTRSSRPRWASSTSRSTCRPTRAGRHGRRGARGGAAGQPQRGRGARPGDRRAHRHDRHRCRRSTPSTSPPRRSPPTRATR